jgi:hypothetical protein
VLKAFLHFAGAVVKSLVSRPKGWKGAAATLFPIKIVIANFFHPDAADFVVVGGKNGAHLPHIQICIINFLKILHEPLKEHLQPHRRG